MLCALSITHGFLPPHPSPTALVVQLNADMGKTLFYGLLVAIPTVIIAGPIFSKTVKKIHSRPIKSFEVSVLPEEKLPSAINSFVSALFPILLLLATSVLSVFEIENEFMRNFLSFFSDTTIVMLIALLLCTYTLGIRMGKSIVQLMESYGEAAKDIVMVLLILAGAGALKQVLLDSGASVEIVKSLGGLNLPILFLGWTIAAVIRVLLGSATIAGLTTAGIIAPLVLSSGVNASLMVLSIGAGSLMFSHVNDTGFWMFKEYFNLSIKDTIRSWSLMESIVSICGLVGVLVLDYFIK